MSDSRKIHYWHGVICVSKDPRLHDQTCVGKVQRMLDGECSSDDLKGLKTSNGTILRRFRINDKHKERVLYTDIVVEGKRYLLLLEYLDNHKYESSHTFNNVFVESSIAKAVKQLSQTPTHAVDDEQNSSDAYVIDVDTLMTDIPLQPLDEQAQGPVPTADQILYFNRRYIALDSGQNKVRFAQYPFCVRGGPGSGKSTTSLALIAKEYESQKTTDAVVAKELKPIVYVAKSTYLVNKMRAEWEENRAIHEEEGHFYPEVKFLTHHEFIKSLMPETQPHNILFVGFEQFKEWLEKKKKEHPLKARYKELEDIVEKSGDKHTDLDNKIYQEFYICSAVASRQDYEDLGEANYLFKTEAERNVVYALYEAYKHNQAIEIAKQGSDITNPSDLTYDERAQLGIDPLKTNIAQLTDEEKQKLTNVKQLNPALLGWVELSRLGIEPRKYVGTLLADEGQDYSSQEHRIFHYASEQFVVNMDTHQALTVSVSLKNALQKLFLIHPYKNKDNCFVTLNSTYRCPQAVIELANSVIRAKRKVSRKADKKEVDSVECVNEEVGSVHWLKENANADAQALMRKYKDINIAVIVPQAFKKEAQEKFPGIAVFTPEEIKGLEYELVIGYKLLEDPLFLPANKKLEPGNTDTNADDTYIIPFNKVFTAITRATKEFVMMQNERHENKNIVHHLQEGVTFAAAQQVDAAEADEERKEGPDTTVKPETSIAEEENAIWVVLESGNVKEAARLFKLRLEGKVAEKTFDAFRARLEKEKNPAPKTVAKAIAKSKIDYTPPQITQQQQKFANDIVKAILPIAYEGKGSIENVFKRLFNWGDSPRAKKDNLINVLLRAQPQGASDGCLCVLHHILIKPYARKKLYEWLFKHPDALSLLDPKQLFTALRAKYPQEACDFADIFFNAIPSAFINTMIDKIPGFSDEISDTDFFIFTQFILGDPDCISLLDRLTTEKPQRLTSEFIDSLAYAAPGGTKPIRNLLQSEKGQQLLVKWMEQSDACKKLAIEEVQALSLAAQRAMHANPSGQVLLKAAGVTMTDSAEDKLSSENVKEQSASAAAASIFTALAGIDEIDKGITKKAQIVYNSLVTSIAFITNKVKNADELQRLKKTPKKIINLLFTSNDKTTLNGLLFNPIPPDNINLFYYLFYKLPPDYLSELCPQDLAQLDITRVQNYIKQNPGLPAPNPILLAAFDGQILPRIQFEAEPAVAASAATAASDPVADKEAKDEDPYKKKAQKIIDLIKNAALSEGLNEINKKLLSKVIAQLFEQPTDELNKILFLNLGDKVCLIDYFIDIIPEIFIDGFPGDEQDKHKINSELLMEYLRSRKGHDTKGVPLYTLLWGFKFLNNEKLKLLEIDDLLDANYESGFNLINLICLDTKTLPMAKEIFAIHPQWLSDDRVLKALFTPEKLQVPLAFAVTAVNVGCDLLLEWCSKPAFLTRFKKEFAVGANLGRISRVKQNIERHNPKLFKLICGAPAASDAAAATTASDSAKKLSKEDRYYRDKAQDIVESLVKRFKKLRRLDKTIKNKLLELFEYDAPELNKLLFSPLQVGGTLFQFLSRQDFIFFNYIQTSHPALLDKIDDQLFLNSTRSINHHTDSDTIPIIEFWRSGLLNDKKLKLLKLEDLLARIYFRAQVNLLDIIIAEELPLLRHLFKIHEDWISDNRLLDALFISSMFDGTNVTSISELAATENGRDFLKELCANQIFLNRVIHEIQTNSVCLDPAIKKIQENDPDFYKWLSDKASSLLAPTAAPSSAMAAAAAVATPVITNFSEAPGKITINYEENQSVLFANKKVSIDANPPPPCPPSSQHSPRPKQT